MREIPARRANQKAYEYVFDYFSDKILSGELKLNDRIPTERDIAERLGVSRNSAREALHILEMMGIIECLQGSGNYIRCDSQEYMLKAVNMMMVLQQISYTEVLQMRRSYEATALQLAMDAITPEELESLHQILTQMDLPMSVQASARLDVAFHATLVQASHNRLLVFYTSLISELLDRFIKNLRTSILTEKRRAAILNKSHWDIYEALVTKDRAAGAKALEKHFEVVGAHVASFEKKK